MSEKHQECSECGKPLAHRVHSPANGTHAYREPGASPQATEPPINLSPVAEYWAEYHNRPIEEADTDELLFAHNWAQRGIGREDAGSPAERQQPSKLHNEGSSPSSPSNSNINIALHRAAQPAAGTTVDQQFAGMATDEKYKAESAKICSEFDRLSAGTTPQAERPDDTVRFRERLKKISFLITGNDYAFLSENPEIEESLKVYVENVTEARAVAPVETANFVQLLPGGMCFAHGRYEGYQCPQWPKCITDPQKQEYLAQAQTLNATTFGDAGEG